MDCDVAFVYCLIAVFMFIAYVVFNCFVLLFVFTLCIDGCFGLFSLWLNWMFLGCWFYGKLGLQFGFAMGCCYLVC